MLNSNKLRLSVIKPIFDACVLRRISKNRIGTKGNGMIGDCFNFGAVLEKKAMRGWLWAALVFLGLCGSNAIDCPLQF